MTNFYVKVDANVLMGKRSRAGTYLEDKAYRVVEARAGSLIVVDETGRLCIENCNRFFYHGETK